MSLAGHPKRPRIVEASLACTGVLLLVLVLGWLLASDDTGTESEVAFERPGESVSRIEPEVGSASEASAESISDLGSVERVAQEVDRSETSIHGILRVAAGRAPGVETELVAIPVGSSDDEIARWFSRASEVIPDGVLVTLAEIGGTFRFDGASPNREYSLVARTGGVIVPDPTRVRAGSQRYVVAAGFCYGIEVEAKDATGRGVALDRIGSYRSDDVVASWRGNGRLLDRPCHQLRLHGLPDREDVGDRMVRRYFVVAPERAVSLDWITLSIRLSGFAPTTCVAFPRRIDLGLMRQELTLTRDGSCSGNVALDFVTRSGPRVGANRGVPTGILRFGRTDGTENIEFQVSPQWVGDDLRYRLCEIPCGTYRVEFLETATRESIPILDGGELVHVDSLADARIRIDATALCEVEFDLAIEGIDERLDRDTVRLYLAGGRANAARSDLKLLHPLYLAPRSRRVRIGALPRGRYVVVVTADAALHCRVEIELAAPFERRVLTAMTAPDTGAR